MDETSRQAAERLKRRVQRHSPDRLLRQKLMLPGGITISAEKHRGRVMVRVESPQVEKPTVNGLGNLGKSG